MTSTPSETTEALPAGVWTIDPSATTLTTTVKKLLFITVSGKLTVTGGSIEIAEDGTVATVEITADANSYDSGNGKRDTEVRGGGFLDADQYPEISFRTGEVSSAGGGYRSTGSVTVKGAVTPLDVEISGVKYDDKVCSFTATATMDRNQLGLGKLPSLVIANNVQLVVEAVVLRSS